MKDKRTYINKKEHGEDMTHENESKIDTTPIQLLTEQYKTELHKYREREGLYIQTENQLKATKQIVIEMSGTIRQLHTENENLKAEVSRLLEEIQLLEMKIKK
jgi:predicted RNase H-like nuclease (RuvC/YqgF family)